MSSTRPGRTRVRVFVAHLAVVCGLALAFVIVSSRADPAEGANIGAGIVLLPLLALGLPWSLAFLVDPYRYDQQTAALWYAVSFGPALLNVALHALLLASRSGLRGRGRPGSGQ